MQTTNIRATTAAEFETLHVRTIVEDPFPTHIRCASCRRHVTPQQYPEYIWNIQGCSHVFHPECLYDHLYYPRYGEGNNICPRCSTIWYINDAESLSETWKAFKIRMYSKIHRIMKDLNWVSACLCAWAERTYPHLDPSVRQVVDTFVLKFFTVLDLVASLSGQFSPRQMRPMPDTSTAQRWFTDIDDLSDNIYDEMTEVIEGHEGVVDDRFRSELREIREKFWKGWVALEIVARKTKLQLWREEQGN